MFVVNSYLTWCLLFVNSYIDEEECEQWRQQESFERPFFFDVGLSILPTKFSQAYGLLYFQFSCCTMQGLLTVRWWTLNINSAITSWRYCYPPFTCEGEVLAWFSSLYWRNILKWKALNSIFYNTLHSPTVDGVANVESYLMGDILMCMAEHFAHLDFNWCCSQEWLSCFPNSINVLELRIYLYIVLVTNV